MSISRDNTMKERPKYCAACGKLLAKAKDPKPAYNRITGRQLAMWVCPERAGDKGTAANILTHDWVQEEQDGTWTVSRG